MRATATSDILPDDVLVEISRVLAVQCQESLSNLSRCSKHLHHITTPYLYRDVRLSRVQAVPLFFQALCYHPDRAHRIRSLNVTGENYPTESENLMPNLDVGEIFTHISHSVPIRQFMEYLQAPIDPVWHYTNRYELGDQGFWLALLVLQLPGLREITVELNRNAFDFEVLFRWAAMNTDGRNFFPSLTTVKIDVNRNQPWAGVELVPLLNVPSLRNVTLVRVHRLNYLGQSVVSQIRSLDLDESLTYSGDVLRLLEGCSHLQTLRIRQPPSLRHREGLEYDILRVLSDTAATSLEDLDYYGCGLSRDHQVVNMADFINLKKLKIASPMILPRPTEGPGSAGAPGSSGESDSGCGLLPLRNIRELTLYISSDWGPLEPVWPAVVDLITTKRLPPTLMTLYLQWLPDHVVVREEMTGLKTVVQAAHKCGLRLHLIEEDVWWPGSTREIVVSEDADVEDLGPMYADMEDLGAMYADVEDLGAMDLDTEQQSVGEIRQGILGRLWETGRRWMAVCFKRLKSLWEV
ncbi:hypothetical protein AYL99_11759 [Fonsecaea erecta]|uniref:F-box domain-containing protein n=1 Tax=Fonsecaea erecta TaxID=1367422 RepID=A0A178Z2H2_9EURO|nr:hypothetical protein AYL99_11759 [Fonsecaea erecta]OAP53999.1 hypothetical protein AYL99_11759 [Fonsecaea erecta]